MRSQLFVFMVSIAMLARAQEGFFPINDHVHSFPSIDHVNYDIEFDHHGLMYVANRSGLLRYDGSYWEYVKTPSAILSLAIDASNNVYAGRLGGFGYFDLSPEGLHFYSISPDTISNEHFESVRIIGDSIVFLSNNQLWTYHPSSGKMNYYSSPDRFGMKAIVFDGEDVLISTEIASYKWDGSSMKESDKWIGKDYPPVKLSKSPDGSSVLSLDLTGNLFIKSGDEALKYLPDVSIVNDFEWINDTLFVTSTTDDGCMIFSTKTLEEIGRVNYSHGLPDNEIMTMEVDWGKGIWIAHQFGFSRVDPIAPVYRLSNQEGIEGNLIKSIIFNNELLVGTSSGLFRLANDSIFRTEALMPDSTIKKNSTGERGKEFAFRKQKYVMFPQVISKVNDLKIFEDVVLVGTNEGMFEYDGAEVIKILNHSVKKIIISPKNDEFLIVGKDKSVGRYLRKGGQYSALPFRFDDFTALSLFYDRKGLIWLVTPGKILVFGVNDDAVVIDEQDFPNKFFENPTIVELNNKLYFVSTEGFHFYDYLNRELRYDSTLTKKYGRVVDHFPGHHQSLWMFDGKVWKYIDNNGDITGYPYLSLFSGIRDIYQHENGIVYFITENNELFNYNPPEDRNQVYQSNIFYKHLFAKSTYSRYRERVNLEYDENYLQAELSQPDYLGLLKVEFQHKVIGRDQEWSEWTADNTIDIKYIPEGEYSLAVRSKDVFGRVQTIAPITLVINPPYWRTTWFYFLEVLFFASLVVISTKLNQSNAANRYLTEGLTILTIIMIIETIQSAASAYLSLANSAFIDFLINLSIALIIFPLELLLKKIIKGGKIPIPVKSQKKKEKKIAEA